jgi:hypothetical protein
MIVFAFVRCAVKFVLDYFKLFPIISCLIFSSSAFADLSAIKAANNQFGAQVISTKIDYTETGYGIAGSNTGPLDTEAGNVPGYAAYLSLMNDEDNSYFAAELDQSSGQTIYTGTQQPGSYGSVVNTSSTDQTNYYFRLGKGFASEAEDSQAMATLYFELGGHKWDRGIGGAVSYLQTYSNNYLVFGGLGQYSPDGSKLVLSANADWGITFNPSISSSLENVGTRGNPPSTLCGFSADYEFPSHIHGIIRIDIAGFSYVISTVYTASGNAVFAPDTNIYHTTIKMGFGYAF